MPGALEEVDAVVRGLDSGGAAGAGAVVVAVAVVVLLLRVVNEPLARGAGLDVG
jgi:hypothetical protein